LTNRQGRNGIPSYKDLKTREPLPTRFGEFPCAIGDGVNAENIKNCLGLLRDQGYDGALSMECEGQGRPMIERSWKWLRGTLAELSIPVAR
jgi:sugar phosphate isomerase/epimerase